MSETKAALREQILADAKNYIVVNDGQFMYPVQKTDLRGGDTEEVVRSMSGDEYGEWCQAVPADLRVGDVGTRECIDLCKALVSAGAEVWRV